MYWHEYLHLQLYKVNSTNNPVPPVKSIQLLSNTHLPDCQQVTKRQELGLEVGAKKFQTALSVSKQRNWKYIQKQYQSAQHACCCEVTATALCMLLLAVLPVKANKGYMSRLFMCSCCVNSRIKAYNCG